MYNIDSEANQSAENPLNSTRFTSMRRRKKRIFPKIAGILLVLILVLAAFAYFALYLPYTRIRAKGTILVAAAKEMKDIFKANDIDLLKKKYSDIEAKYADFKKESQSVYWLSFVPQVNDYKNALTAGDYLLDAGKLSIDAVEPYADIIGLKKGTESFVNKSGEDRLQTAVLTLDKVLPKVDAISTDIEKAEKLIATIDPNRYPETINGKPVRSKLVEYKNEFDGIASLFVQAKPLVKQLPLILGANKEQTYLILFQNDKEQRATGGFLTAYALFRIKDGKMKIEKSEDIYTLDASISKHGAAPEKIRTYARGITQFYIRDSNLSPDFPTSVKTFDEIYQNSGSKVKYDGVIAIDTKVLVDLLTVYGDAEVNGIRFSATPTKECNCPQVIYKLLDLVDKPKNYIDNNRKGILGDLMYYLFYRALSFSPSKYWPILFQQMFANMEEKHIMLYFADSERQKAVETINFGNRINAYDGDYLHINNVNFSGAKTNLFVNETITSETKFGSGAVERTVSVQFKNPFPASDCNLERGNLCLNAVHRNWIRFYVPQGSKLVKLAGSSKPTQTYDELGKTVFEGYVEVPTKGQALVNVTYTLPSSITESNYKLMMQKQGGEETQQLKVNIGGSNVFSGVFVKDSQFKAK